MSENKQLTINLTLKEIDEVLCPKCKKKLRELIKEKLPDELIDRLVMQQQQQ